MDRDLRDLSASKSKCWDCKFGMCFMEVGFQSMYNKNPDDNKDIFNTAYSHKEDSDGEMIEETLLPITNVKTLCFWKPESIQTAHPIIVGLIEECSKYDNKR